MSVTATATTAPTIEPAESGLIMFTKPGCVQCQMTKRVATAKGIPLEERQIEDYPELVSYLVSQGQLQMPFVLPATGNLSESWSGFRPEHISAHATV